MPRSRWIIQGLAMASLIANLLIPPWVHTLQLPGRAETRRPAGYGLVFAPPAIESPTSVSGIAVDYGRLGVQTIALALLWLAVGTLFPADPQRPVPVGGPHRDRPRRRANPVLGSLGYQIKEHWWTYRPQMTAALEREGTLDAAVFAAQELTLKAEAEAIQAGMSFDQAREQWAFLPDEEDVPELGTDPREWTPPEDVTFESATARDTREA